jgi:hypothetical protein
LTSWWLARVNSGNSTPKLGDFERTASDSANNPCIPTDCSTSDEPYDERIERSNMAQYHA